MSYWAAGSAALGAAGSYFGGDDKVHPMDAVPKHLRGDYKNFSGQVAGMPVPEYYQGQLVADQNPWLTGSLGDMYGYGQPGGMGFNTMNQMYGAGTDLMNMGINHANQMAANGPNQFQYDQNTYDQAFGNLSGGMQNQFDLGARNISRGFDWGMLPGLNMQNALGGGQGSTKFGQAGALGQAMADQNVMQFGSNLWSNAANQANQNAMFGGQQNLASANNYDSRMLGLTNQGSNMLGSAYDMGRQNLGLGFAAGDYQQRYNQSLIDAEKAKWDYEQMAPQEHLQWQLGMIPGPGGYSPNTTGTNLAQGAMQGLGTYMMAGGQMPDLWGNSGGDIWGSVSDPFLSGAENRNSPGYISF